MFDKQFWKQDLDSPHQFDKNNELSFKLAKPKQLDFFIAK